MKNQDKLWKRLIEKFFRDFVKFFFTDLYDHIDFSEKCEFLDNELITLSSKTKPSSRYVDKLVKVKLKDASNLRVLIHIEVQGYNDEKFRERMFRYFCRLFDKYDLKITAIAIFTDNNPNYKPSSYTSEFFQTKIRYDYRIYKVLEQDDAELEADLNIFSIPVLAVKHVNKYKNNLEQKFQFKRKLFQLLTERGHSKEYIYDFTYFIDGLIEVTPEKDNQIFTEIINKEKIDMETKEIIGSWAKTNYKKGKLEGLRKGKLEGKLEGKLTIAKALHLKGFQIEEIIELTGLTTEQLNPIINP